MFSGRIRRFHPGLLGPDDSLRLFGSTHLPNERNLEGRNGLRKWKRRVFQNSRPGLPGCSCGWLVAPGAAGHFVSSRTVESFRCQFVDSAFGQLFGLDQVRGCLEARDLTIGDEAELADALFGNGVQRLAPFLREHWFELFERGILLDKPNQPGPDVFATAVIQVARALRCKEQTDPCRPAAAKEVFQGWFGDRNRIRRQVTVRFVNHHQQLQLR